MESLALLTQKLVFVVEAEIEADRPSAPAWMVPEGERVLENAKTLFHAVKLGSEKELLCSGSVIQFLGESWLNCHGKAYTEAENLEIFLRKTNAT